MSQGLYETRRHFIQLASMILRQPAENMFPFARYAQNCTALVVIVRRSRQQPLAL
jgi:hypothetical protein